MGKKLEEFKDLLTDPEYVYYMHGTGRLSDDRKTQANVVASIFENGLRASHNSMYWTTVSYGTGDDVNKNWNDVRHNMDHWVHGNSKNIIVIRFPKKYINERGDESIGERDYAIYNEVLDPETNQTTRYINPKLVVGCYHAKNGNFTLNPNFEKELSPETEKDLQSKYEKGLEEYNERINTKYIDPPTSMEIARQKENGDDKEDTFEAWELGLWE